MPISVRKSDLTLLRLGLLKVCDYEAIDRLLAGIASHVAGEHAALAETAKAIQSQPADAEFDREFEEMMLGDERVFLGELQELSAELAIVALYKKIEISTKQAVVLALPNIAPDKLFQIKELKKALKAEGINISSLPNFRAMDELRCINNSVKHSGVVSSELSAYPGWKMGQRLSNLESAYRRLAPLATSYVSELVGALMKCHRLSAGR